MAGEKKTEVMTIRVSATTKKIIEEEAAKREWTPSKLSEKILTTWATQEKEKAQTITFMQSQIQNININ